jgi:hypothetical protein
VRARGLRPRGVLSRLAIATRSVWPSAYLHGVGTPELSKISRLDTRPARSPVNASPTTSQSLAHDSEPVWVAGPLPYETFIRNTSPVLPAHGDMLETVTESGHPMSPLQFQKQLRLQEARPLLLAGDVDAATAG